MTTETKTHHWASPSALPRLLLCPGSHGLIHDEELDRTALNEGKPERLVEKDDDDVGSARGTYLHACVAECVLVPSDDMEAKLLELMDDDSDREQVKACLDWLFHTFGAGFEVLGVEETLSLRLGTLQFEDWAHVDLAIKFNGHSQVHVIDWKFQRDEIDPDYLSPQLMGYAAGAFQQWEPATVKAWVFHPLSGMHYVTEYTSEEGLLGFISEIVNNANDVNAPLRPGVQPCRYCDARAFCPALRQQSLALVERNERIPTDPRALGEMFAKAKAAEVFLKAFFKEVRQTALGGGPVPEGYTLVERKSSAKIEEPRLAYAALQHKFNPTEFLNCCDVRIPQLKKAYQERNTDMTEKEVDAAISEMLEPVITRAEPIQYLRFTPVPKEVQDDN